MLLTRALTMSGKLPRLAYSATRAAQPQVPALSRPHHQMMTGLVSASLLFHSIVAVTHPIPLK